jgi:hypothetical protein
LSNYSTGFLLNTADSQIKCILNITEL